MNTINRVIKRLDVFGAPVGLVSDKHSEYRSVFGSVMSILSFLCIFLFFRSSLLSFITKDKVIYSVDSQYSQSPSWIGVNRTTFMFAVGFEQPNSDFTTYPFFNVTATQTYYKMNGTTRVKTTKVVDLEPCTEEHFQLMGRVLYEKVAILNSNNFLCPELTQTMDLEGQYTSDLFSFVKIIVSRCDNKYKLYDQRTWKPLSCGSDTDYNKFLVDVQKPRVSFYTSDYNINPSEKSNYAQPFIQNQQSFSFVPLSMVKSADLFVTPYNTNTNESVWTDNFGNEETFNVLQVEDTVETSDYLTGSSAFVNLFLRRSPKTYVIMRYYKKIADVMSQIGGLVKCVFVLFGYFVTKYNKFHFRLELANKLYTFQFSSQKAVSEKHAKQQELLEEGKENSINHNNNGTSHQPSNNSNSQNRQQPQQQLVPASSASLDREISDHLGLVDHHKPHKIHRGKTTAPSNNHNTSTNNPLKQHIVSFPGSPSFPKTLEAFKQAHKAEQRSVLLEYFEKIMSTTRAVKTSVTYFLSFLTFGKCFVTEETALIKKAQEFSKRDMDIYVILDKLQEIEKMKKVIFSSDQITLFNFFPKPVIKKDIKLYQNKSLREFNMQKNKQRRNHTKQFQSEKDHMHHVDSPRSQLKIQSEGFQGSGHLFKERDNFTTIEAYKNLFSAYAVLTRGAEATQPYNQKLIEQLGVEVRKVFELQNQLTNAGLEMSLLQGGENLHHKNKGCLGESSESIMHEQMIKLRRLSLPVGIEKTFQSQSAFSDIEDEAISFAGQVNTNSNYVNGDFSGGIGFSQKGKMFQQSLQIPDENGLISEIPNESVAYFMQQKLIKRVQNNGNTNLNYLQHVAKFHNNSRDSSQNPMKYQDLHQKTIDFTNNSETDGQGMSSNNASCFITPIIRNPEIIPNNNSQEDAEKVTVITENNSKSKKVNLQRQSQSPIMKTLNRRESSPSQFNNRPSVNVLLQGQFQQHFNQQPQSHQQQVKLKGKTFDIP